jgi:hypothetical protein
MTNFSPLGAKFLIACFPKASTAPETWNEIMQHVFWSLNALVQGMHPMHDAFGKPLKKGSHFFEKKGASHCAQDTKQWFGASKVMLFFFSNNLGLPHWGSKHPCMECDCTSSDADESKWFKTIQMEKQSFKYTSNSEAAEHPPSNHPLFHQVPGLASKFVRGDALHILWVHGIYSHLLGSVLHYLVYNDGPGRQKKSPQDRLSILRAALQKVCSQLKPTTRVTNLKLPMFVDPKVPHASHPALSLKGSESKHFLPAFLQVCKTLLDRDVWQEACILDSMQAMQDLVDVCNKADIIPTEAEFGEAMALGKGPWTHTPS